MEALLIYFGGAILIAATTYFIHNKLIDHLLFVPFLLLQVGFNAYAMMNIGNDINEYFRFDELGVLFMTVLTIISVPVCLHSVISARRRQENNKEIRIHNAALLVFITMMTGVLISAHLGILWAFLEATTLSVAALIYHERNSMALEATWKYVFVASIGIAMAFLGILFLAVASKDVAEAHLSIDELSRNIKEMNPKWLKMSFLFILTGFSVKIGIVPLFTVDIDAKDAAPSAIGALLSGGLLNIGFVAVFRFYQVFAQSDILTWMNNVLLLVGTTSILFAAVYLMKVKNYKRMFAYSSVEHAGIAFLALASGGIGYFVCIFHLVLHSFVKAGIFLQLGQVQHIFRIKNTDETGEYMRLNPFGAGVLLLGFLSITAMPPSGLFVTEFLAFKALFEAKYYFIAGFSLLLLTFIIYGIGKNILHLLFQKLPAINAETNIEIERNAKHISPLESVSQYILIVAGIYLGFFPPDILVNCINKIVAFLPTAVMM